MRALSLLVLFFATSAAAEDTWFRIESDSGHLVGWQHEQALWDEDGKFHEIRETVMAYRVDGHPPTRSIARVESWRDPAGRLVRMRVQTNGRIRNLTPEGDRLFVTDAQGRPMGSHPLSPGLDLRDGESLLALDRAGSGSADFADLAAGEMRPVAARTEQSPVGENDPTRTTVIIRHGDRIRHAWFVERNAAGTIISADQPLFGSTLRYRRSDRPLDASDLAKPASLPHQLKSAPYRIDPGALRGHIRYGFAAPPGVFLTLPESGEQAVRETADKALQLDICTGCGPGLSTDPADLDRWRRPSPWLQSDAAEIVRAARGVANSKATDRQRMNTLAMIARRRLASIDYEGHLSALDAWKRGSGDCTEDAVLLAALARAAGIPARVVNGLVYSRERYHGATNAFFPHSWVVAYADGEWRSFDMTTGGFDATHIALDIGDGELGSIVAANQTAALLDWRAMAEVRKRPVR